jgi:hypothetical protein
LTFHPEGVISPVSWRCHVRDRFVTVTFASAAILLMVSSLAAQAPTATTGKPWNPARTADGKPDLQGMWAATVGGHTFEEGGDSESAIIQGDEPPSGERPKVIVDNQPWLDSHGSFYTDTLHVVERWRLADENTISYEATVTDPKVFTRPWTLAFTLGRNRDRKYEFLEIACHEGYKPDLALEAGRALRAKGQTGIHEHTKGFYGGK